MGSSRTGAGAAHVAAVDLFSIGVGPSSSHTVGPMRAARRFVEHLEHADLAQRTDRVTCTLYGSLGATGIGHGTPDAVVAGLAGHDPETCDPDDVREAWGRRGAAGEDAPLLLAGRHPVRMPREAVTLAPLTRLPGHPNALTLAAWADGEPLPLLE